MKLARTIPALLLLVALAAGSAFAGVTVTFDRQSLNTLLGAMAEQTVNVDVTDQLTLAVELKEFELLRMEGPGAANHQGFLFTRLKIEAPQVGLVATVEPRLSLHVVERDGSSWFEVRFERVELALPIARLDLAPMIDPIVYPADATFSLDGAGDPVRIRSRVSNVRVTDGELRFEIEMTVVP